MAVPCLYAWTTGPAYIYWAKATSYSNCISSYGADVLLGLSDNGVNIALRYFWDRVDADDYGGRAGPPADEQFFGGQATIDFVLTKYYDIPTLETLFCLTTTAGIFPAMGSFKRQDALHGRIKLITRNQTIYIYICSPETAAWNVGSSFRKQRLAFRAEMDGPCTRQLYGIGSGADPCT